MLRCGGNAKKVTRGRHNLKVVQHHSHDALNAMKKNLLKDGKSNYWDYILRQKLNKRRHNFNLNLKPIDFRII